MFYICKPKKLVIAELQYNRKQIEKSYNYFTQKLLFIVFIFKNDNCIYVYNAFQPFSLIPTFLILLQPLQVPLSTSSFATFISLGFILWPTEFNQSCLCDPGL